MFFGVGQRPHVGTIKNDMDKSANHVGLSPVSLFYAFKRTKKPTNFRKNDGKNSTIVK
jgi:hypothetical protein